TKSSLSPKDVRSAAPPKTEVTVEPTAISKSPQAGSNSTLSPSVTWQSTQLNSTSLSSRYAHPLIRPSICTPEVKSNRPLSPGFKPRRSRSEGVKSERQRFSPLSRPTGVENPCACCPTP